VGGAVLPFDDRQVTADVIGQLAKVNR